jgi:hypothetical protein
MYMAEAESCMLREYMVVGYSRDLDDSTLSKWECIDL